MMLNRWKVLACTLTVGVGGLAVFATPPADPKENPKEPGPLPILTVKPASSPKGSDTAPPTKPVKVEEFDLDIPLVAPPVPPKAKADEPAAKPKSEPVFLDIDIPIPPPVIVPVKAEVPAKKDAPKPEPDKFDTPPPPIAPPLPLVKEPTKKVKGFAGSVIGLPEPGVPTPDLDLPVRGFGRGSLVEMPVKKPEVAAPIKATPPVDAGQLPSAWDVSGNTAATEPAKLKMLVRMGDAKPRFEIRSSASQELLLKVYGERIEMQTPPEGKTSVVGVSAQGKVRFTAPGIEGTCDHLTILSGTGEVLLKGNIHLKTKRGKSWSEMTAEKMVYQIGNAGLATTRNPVTPATYIPE